MTFKELQETTGYNTIKEMQENGWKISLKVSKQSLVLKNGEVLSTIRVEDYQADK